MAKYSIPMAALLGSLAFAGAAWGQVDSGVKYHLYESGRLVGEVFVEAAPPERDAAPPEHWIVYPEYQYPGLRYIGELMVTPVPSLEPYDDLEDFVRNASFPAGSKYIRMDVETFTSLPGR